MKLFLQSASKTVSARTARTMPMGLEDVKLSVILGCTLRNRRGTSNGCTLHLILAWMGSL